MAKYQFLVDEATKYARATKGSLAPFPGLPLAIVPQYGPDAPALLRKAIAAGAVRVIEATAKGAARSGKYVIPA
jgi:hypothetical protein